MKIVHFPRVQFDEFLISESPRQLPNGSYECNIENIKLIADIHRKSDDTYTFYDFRVIYLIISDQNSN
jgi:hypothetical protein